MVADVFVHNLASQLSCFLEFFVFEEELFEHEALLLLLDNLDSKDRDEGGLEGGG